MSANKTGSSTPTAGQCYVCRVWTTKRYGGEGHHLAMCKGCWARGGVSPSGADEPGETPCPDDGRYGVRPHLVVGGVCHTCAGEEAARRARLEERGIF